MTQNAFPIRPLPDNDPRFTIGLLADVKNVLTAHGYETDNMSGSDFMELQQALYRFLYGERK